MYTISLKVYLITLKPGMLYIDNRKTVGTKQQKY